MIKRSNYVCIAKQTISKTDIDILFGGFVETGEQTKLQQKVFPRFLVAGCTLLLQAVIIVVVVVIINLYLYTKSYHRIAALIRKNFFPEDTEFSVRNLLCLALGGRVELGGGERGRGEKEREKL